jgi:hypothetical protein
VETEGEKKRGERGCGKGEEGGVEGGERESRLGSKFDPLGIVIVLV